MDVNDYLSNFPEKIPVAVNIAIRGGEVQKYSATVLVTDPPEVELHFDVNVLPESKRIDTEADCLVFIETGEIVTLISSIEEVAGRDLLRITVHNVIQHVEKREFFRGPAGRLSLSCRRKGPGGGKPFSGKGVNISCGGVLMMVHQEMQKKEKLAMEIRVPEPVQKSLEADAIVLRVSQVKKGTFLAAVRFTNMDSETCDDIMAFCFAEQRRMLREQVLTRDL